MCPLLTSFVVLGLPNLNTSKASLTLAVPFQVQPSVMDRKVLKGIPQWIPVVASSSSTAPLAAQDAEDTPLTEDEVAALLLAELDAADDDEEASPSSPVETNDCLVSSYILSWY